MDIVERNVPRLVRGSLIRRTALLGVLALFMNIVVSFLCGSFGLATHRVRYHLSSHQAKTMFSAIQRGLAEDVNNKNILSDFSLFGLTEYNGVGITWMRLDGIQKKDGSYRNCLLVQAGFPFRALEAYTTSASPNHLVGAHFLPLETSGNPIAQIVENGKRAVPIRPRAIAMMLNTGIFFLVIASAAAIHRKATRRRRLRRGECVRCRYLVESMPICPECGAVQPVTTRHRERSMRCF